MALRRTLFFSGLALFLGPTLVEYYLTWPLPGSQGLESLRWAYALGKVTWLTEIAGAVIALAGFVWLLKGRPSRRTLIWTGLAAFVALALFGATAKFSAPATFKPATVVEFAKGPSDELPPETLVMGITAGSESKAYPIRLLAYHHRVEDTLDGQPIWVTYCTMCRTGKIFRPIIDGRQLEFDLVGAIRYNSTYRDRATGSYWYQANGKAVAGPLEGEVLPELRTDQMTLANWLELYPESAVLQPDPASTEGYELFNFDKFDEARSKPENPVGWQWVVGVVHQGTARGYPWSELATVRLIQDQVGDLPLAIQLHSDGISQRVWDRRLDGRVLDLTIDPDTDRLVDAATGSSFGFDGEAIDGELAGQKLRPVTATVEYRHSFEYFSKAEIYEAAAAG